MSMSMEQQQSFIERRKHKRYQLSDDILVFNESTFGQIINISKGGLAFRFLTSKDISQNHYFELGILNSASGFYLENIPCMTVTSTDSTPIHPTGSTIVRRNGVQFGELSSEQMQKIEEFLAENVGKIPSSEETSH
ncbi:MAG: PilZ domain-containing protein [Deltaproteobacteria bacterium]|nr:PilZ domain-containing protein [Deltaproteobacteria bacterium]